MYGGGSGHIITEAGNYNGEFTSTATNTLFSLVALANGISHEITIDNIKVWEKGGDAKQTLTASNTVDSSIVNDLIATYIDTMASDTSLYTLDEIDKVVKNSMIQNYEVKNVTTADEFTIFWTDDAIVIDSIQCESDDSVTIQIDLSHTATNVFTTAQLINGITTLSTFAEDSVTDKATLQFTQIGDNLGYLRLRIYWSFL